MTIMSFEDWYNRQDKVHFRDISRRYDFILLDCCAFGFSSKTFLESRQEMGQNNNSKEQRRQIRQEYRALDQQREVIIKAENMCVTTGVFGELKTLIEIINHRTRYLGDVVNADRRRNREKGIKQQRGQNRLESLRDSFEDILDLYKDILEILPECRIIPETFYFSSGKSSVADKEIVATALTYFRKKEDQKIAILTRDHDIMYLLIQHFQRQAKARKEDLNQRLGVYFVSREEPSQAVEVKAQPYLSGEC